MRQGSRVTPASTSARYPSTSHVYRQAAIAAAPAVQSSLSARQVSRRQQPQQPQQQALQHHQQLPPASPSAASVSNGSIPSPYAPHNGVAAFPNQAAVSKTPSPPMTRNGVLRYATAGATSGAKVLRGTMGGAAAAAALPGRGITRDGLHASRSGTLINNKTSGMGGGLSPMPEEMPRRDFPFRPHQKPARDFELGDRPPRKRALVVGCNYVMAPDIQLRGCCNDAAAVALTLINQADFRAEEVVLLLDQWPAECYRNPQFQDALEEEEADGLVLWKDRQPTRRNILLGLNWLRADCRDGDVLFFYFAGHGIQIDDMSGWEGEGYDEAILPMDFFGAEVNVLTALHIRQAIVNVGCAAQLTIVLDCAGGQTALDPAGTGSAWRYIAGLKQRGMWPFLTDSTDKVKRATYNSAAWLSDDMQKRGARPRFVPGVDVSSVAALTDPALQRIPDYIEAQLRGFLFAGAPWSQTPVEAKMPQLRILALSDGGAFRQVAPQSCKKTYAYHGVFTWAWLTSLHQLLTRQVTKHKNRRVTYADLLAETQAKIKWLRSTEGGLPKLSQTPELTFLKNGGGTSDDCIFWHSGGRSKHMPFTVRPGHRLPCLPHETRYLSAWEAEAEWNRIQRRTHLLMCAQAKNGGCPHFRMPRAPPMQLDALQKHEMLGAPAFA